MTLSAARTVALFTALGLQAYGTQQHRPTHHRPAPRPDTPLSVETIQAVGQFVQPGDPGACLHEARDSAGAGKIGFHHLYGGQVSCSIGPTRVVMSLFNEDRSRHLMLEYLQPTNHIDVLTEDNQKTTGHYIGSLDSFRQVELVRPIVDVMVHAVMPRQ